MRPARGECDCVSVYDDTGWMILIRAHDHVWQDRTTPLKERIEICMLLHRLALLREVELWDKREAELGRKSPLGLS
jgi:hypothetical protein